ncbi:augmin complex subunit dgt2 [Anopheles cruzii]|uniref:augmin complex subunit dgt2 n=1 Tax=Anopheles cruzii TaxID=68878 RepID=UPI0022EC46E5|nr:augmin complex subunit dgt2 [Anopheles cruzii]
MDDTRVLGNTTELSASQQEELQQEYRKYYQTSLIIALLKQEDAPVSPELRALLYAYKHDGDIPFGLEHIRNVDPGYHERQAIVKYIETKVIEQVRPFVEKAKRFTESGNLEELGSAAYRKQYEILRLDHERQELSKELAQLKTRQLQLMQACAEIRTGPFQRNSVELMHSKARLLQAKAELCQKLVTNDILHCTSHATKAIKEVAANVNKLIGKTD